MHAFESFTHSARYRWIILLIATLAQTAACFFVQGIGAIAVYIQADMGLSALQIGALVSAAQLVPLVGLLIAGELLDRFSERLVVGFGTLVVGIALSVAMLAESYWAMLSILIVVGAGYSTAQPGGSKSVAAWFDRSQRGFAMGIRQAGLPLGGALAAVTLPLVAVTWGWRASFLVGGMVAIFGALVFMLLYRAPAGPVTRPSAGRLGGVLSSRLAMIREPAMKQIMASGISLISVQYGILVFTVLYLHSRLQMDVLQAATLLFVAQAAGVTGRIALAAWSDRCRSRYFPVMVCMLAASVGLMVLIWLPFGSPFMLGCLMAWLGFFGFGWYGPWVAYVAESAPPDKTGFALGLAMAINQVAIVSVPPLLGWMLDLSGSFLPGWSLLIGLTLLGLVLTRQS
ncbi:Sugar phosphate permease [Franzmannia pantelleriensis]|uniref:Sugar phosphate permease n=1 Tax=Franzmannia pantelleriensis TaxID=48727 RepID=A0A1G9TGT9_9GAMM|nr:MFS transporter [Halomonas pantelleriensis]SDM47009.1 Sugar phosphate permease [Halomonas pantelleriensis]